MAASRKISSFRLTSLLRQETDPVLALRLFRNPNPLAAPPKPFPYSAQSYDIIVCKLARAKMFHEMEQVLHQMSQEQTHRVDFCPKEALFCQVISFYGRARLPDSAVAVYRRIPSFRCKRTIRSFNTLIDALLKCGDLPRVQNLCRDLDLVPDACTYNILIRTYCSIGSRNDALKLFDEMSRRGIRPNVATFGTLITDLCLNLRVEDAFKLKDDMLQVYNVKPNVYIYTSLIKSLCESGELDVALKLKDEVASEEEIKLDCAVYATIIRALFKAGRKAGVETLLEEMRKNGLVPDTVTHNAMISGFCEAKEFDAALGVLSEMVKNGCKADVMSYNVIIAGFCKEGKWKEASDLFEDMPRRGCSPDIVSYRTLVDGLCDGMRFKDAAFLLEEMVFKGYKPRPSSICRIVENLNDEAADLLLNVASCLAKEGVIDSHVWSVASRSTCEEHEMGGVFELFDRLRTSC